MKQLDIFDLEHSEMEKMEDGSNLLTKPMEVVMHESMMPYAEHVILDRALPRVEDGLKPVQRRILYSMYEQSNTPDKPTRKSARIVGDCMGRYHPHGDSSIYDAMVRMAQEFSMNVPLVIGQGNFGNIDGDSAAAMRYTEAKLSPAAIELLRDIEKDTVRWSRNFDDTTKEPDMLPGRFPNLLVNGATGIAVGLATNIPPHNFAEVIDGTIAFIENKNITLNAMMKIIKGPDFPTGGYVIPGDGLKQAYETGKGKILVRAKMHIEVAPGDRKNIVITEIPYGVNKADMLIKIANLKDEKKDLFQGIAEIVDESDKEGMRAVIKLRKDCDQQKIINGLLKYSQLQMSYGINMVAIADGKPQLMGLLDIIAYYVNYQRDVILRRSKFELEEAKAREHIVKGLVIAVQNIDEVIQIIKNASSTTDAKNKLRLAFDLSDKQAQAILDLRLARITKLEVNKLILELQELERTIARLTTIINSKKEQMELIKSELTTLKRNFKQVRRSDMCKEEKDAVIPSETDEKPIETVVVGLTADYSLKRIPVKNFNLSNKDAVGCGMSEILTHAIETQTDSKVMFFSNLGNCFKASVSDLPEVRFRDNGTVLSQAFPEAAMGEIPVSVFVLPKEEMPSGELLIYTRQGLIKRSEWTEYQLLKSVFQGYKGKEGDEVFKVEVVRPNTEIFYVTNRGGCTRFDLNEIPLQGRVAGGVRCINLADGEYVVFAGQVEKDTGEILMATNKGFLKRLPVTEITKHARNCKGAKGTEFGVNGTSIVFASYVNSENYQIAIFDRANTYVVEVKDVSVENKNNKGKLPKGKRGGIVVEKVLAYKTSADKVG
ncbi:MAG: DNA topoisomerase 4 subunit A [Corallococcus sp.]|nr:DNA topoisomerase 4 subunit A [Corallococcus sp.]MCM1359218.1 DNA topoisomerase 4 subunit A [Corallococcus sp.]MCM1394608.1 DNA topoisomerase 4 subunit A [Corallococcus sp.]